jgi:hypothetical protein
MLILEPTIMQAICTRCQLFIESIERNMKILNIQPEIIEENISLLETQLSFTIHDFIVGNNYKLDPNELSVFGKMCKDVYLSTNIELPKKSSRIPYLLNSHKFKKIELNVYDFEDLPLLDEVFAR